jgi:hypothetical protein
MGKFKGTDAEGTHPLKIIVSQAFFNLISILASKSNSLPLLNLIFFLFLVPRKISSI